MLAACVLLLPLPSRAGTWVITYANSGKTSFDMIQPPDSLANYPTTNAPTSNVASVTSGSGKVDFIANASVTATLTWQPAYGQTMTTDPPPTSPVSILETATASDSPGPWNGSGPAPIPAGKASDSLGDTQVASGRGYLCTGAHFTQKDGSSGVIKLDPVVMSASCPQTNFINGGTPDWSGSLNATVKLTVQVAKATLGAHSTVDTSAAGNPWNPALPRFFSGTNCSATASAAALSGYVSHAQLLVGGTAVKDYYDTNSAGHPAAGPNVSLGTSQTTAALSVNFDSTHFPDGNPIDIKLVVTDTGGNTYDGKITANAYNKATIYGRNQWETGSGASSAGTYIADSSLTGMSHTDKVNRTLGWNAANILTDIGTCTVFYVNTHGETARTWILSDLDEQTGNAEFVFPSAASASGTVQVLETRQNTSVNIPPIK